MTTQNPTLAEVFAVLYSVRNRRGTASKLNPQQVAEKLGTTDVVLVGQLLHTIFFADMLHMVHFRANPTDTRYTWHYGITARARRVVAALGLDGVTDAVIRTDHHNAMAWRPPVNWAAPAQAAA